MSSDETRTLARSGQGALSGFTATVPMTAVMELIQQVLPPDQRTPQEPEIITREILHRLGLDEFLTEREQLALTGVAHFGYGTAGGVGYALLGRRLPAPPGVRGAAYGLLVWAAGYAGWLPALRILPPPHRRPLGRTALLIAAHLVWGLTIEAMTDRGND